MHIFSDNIESFHTLYITNLQKAYDMEQKIVKALPDLIKNSSNSDLASAFRTHLEQSKGHVTKVESLLKKNTGKASAMTCPVIDSLTSEAAQTIKDVKDADVRDIALIGAGQQVEHHEIAVYGTLRAWAKVLGLSDDATVLESIEKEEFQADDLLSKISQTVNTEAPVTA